MPKSFSQWNTSNYRGSSSQPDALEVQPGAPTPFYRDPLDQARSAFSKRTPEAQYPDGYLDVVHSRRDRLMDGLKARSDRKPTDRGIHRDEHLQAEDYLWPEEFNMFSGLQAEMRGQRYVSPAMVTDAGLDKPQTSDPERVFALRQMAPSWGAGGQGMALPLPPRMP